MSAALMPAILLEPALAVIVVILAASRRFDLPSSIREYTTALRYGIGISGYVLTSVLVYFALYSLCLRLALPGAAYLSLALALLCRRLPVLSAIDVRLRESFHQVAGASFEARRLAATLTPENFRPRPALQQEVRAILLLRGYDADDDWLPAAEPVRKLWLHAATCFFSLRDWEKDGADDGYRRFMAGRARQDYEILRQRFDQLSCQVVRVLATVEKLADLWSDEADAAAATSLRDDARAKEEQRAEDKRLVVTELISDLREDIDFFVDNLSLFIARGVLAASRTERQRRCRLWRLGFISGRLEPSLTVTLFWTGVFYFVAFLVVGLLGGRNPLDHPGDLLWPFVLALTQTMAVSVAIAPKRMFGFANEDLHGNTPWAFVIGAGLAATALAVVLRAALVPDVAGMLLTPRALWLLSPFSTAAATAWLVQDSRWARAGSLARRRMLDAFVLTAAVGGATAAVRVLRFMLFDLPWSPSRLPLDIGLTLAAGLVIGYNVPWKFRNRVLAGGAKAKDSKDRRKLFELLRARAAFGPGR